MNRIYKTPYRGRFAPTPSGPLHFGSLTTAVGSYLQAKSNKGEWLIRIEDIDPPRVVEGATDSILQCLDKYGFEWDGSIIYQSNRLDIYEEVVQKLSHMNLVYPCVCSRKEIAAANAGNPNLSRYPGTCRSGVKNKQKEAALRIRTENVSISFNDSICGNTKQNLFKEVGDFIIKRLDGYYAYHLAVVIDDYDQGITEVIRGSDLLDSTHRQIHLQNILQFDRPNYAHLPLVLDQDGNKMSKQNIKDKPVLECDPVEQIYKALVFLCQHPPVEMLDGDLDSVWSWAMQNWKVQNLVIA